MDASISRRRLSRGSIGSTAITSAGIDLRQVYAAPTSVSGLPHSLLQISRDLLEDVGSGAITSLHIVSARFDGAGRFTPVCVRILPAEPHQSSKKLRPTSYATAGHLAAVAVREYLYTAMHETLLDALAAEHGMRLTTSESAREWLGTTTRTVQQQLTASRRETATQEVLDILSGSRARRQREGNGRGSRFESTIRPTGDVWAARWRYDHVQLE